MTYKLVKIKWWFNFGGLAIYPYMFQVDDSLNIKHEEVHLSQQKGWYEKLWFFGIGAWLFCYLFLLPVGWNPFRWKWEYQAYREGSKLKDSTIRNILNEQYYLWFHA